MITVLIDLLFFGFLTYMSYIVCHILDIQSNAEKQYNESWNPEEFNRTQLELMKQIENGE